jgi:N-acetylmuramoyl-L-alanine amidase
MMLVKVIHHSASRRSIKASTIKGWHKDKGWKDVGYHGLIEDSGDYIPGRDIDKIGAHALGANRNSLGLCIIGNNTVVGQMWNNIQLITAETIIEAWLMMFPGSKIAGHCDVGSTKTVCPGIDVREVFPQFPAVEPRKEI